MSAGTILTFAGNKQALPVARGNYHRQSQIGSAWNEVRMGYLGTVIPSTGDGATVTETVTTASYLDWLCFGLMNTRANSSLIPGVAGVNFVGLAFSITNGNTTLCPSNASGIVDLDCGPVSDKKVVSMTGATVLTSSTELNSEMVLAKYSATTYAIYWALKFTVQNPGASNQTITCSTQVRLASGVAITQANALPTLRTDVLNASYDTAHVLQWNNGGVALPLPDCWFARLPFYNNVMRIAAQDVMLIS